MNLKSEVPAPPKEGKADLCPALSTILPVDREFLLSEGAPAGGKIDRFGLKLNTIYRACENR